MVEQVLAARRVLIVEDEYTLADELRSELSRVGAVVIGPVGHLQGAIDLVRAEKEIDVAVLDVNLRGEAVFPPDRHARGARRSDGLCDRI